MANKKSMTLLAAQNGDIQPFNEFLDTMDDKTKLSFLLKHLECIRFLDQRNKEWFISQIDNDQLEQFTKIGVFHIDLKRPKRNSVQKQ